MSYFIITDFVNIKFSRQRFVTELYNHVDDQDKSFQNFFTSLLKTR